MVEGKKGNDDTPGKVEALILYAARQGNILPLTSRCNVACLFCSHKQNPPGVETYPIAPRTLEQVAACLSFMEPGRKVVIGESVTRIIEGEPFTHPQIKEVLALVRRTLPDTPLEVTTNGTLLTAETVAYLKGLQPLELNLSLNSASPAVRHWFMHDRRGGQALEAARLLQAAGLSYHGSVVAMPWLTGWDDLRATLYFLADAGAKTVRVFLPGYSKLAGPELQFPAAMWEEIAAFLGKLRRELPVPVTWEPRFLAGLEAEVEGVIPGSPAALAGLQTGDIICSVRPYYPQPEAGEGAIRRRGRGKILGGGQEQGETSEDRVFSRVDAFVRIRTLGPSLVTVRRQGQELTLILDKGAGESSGLVMSYDLDPEDVKALARAVGHHRARRVLCFTGKAAFGVVKAALAAQAGQQLRLEREVIVREVPSRFFGGSIVAAGLLVVEDFRHAWQQWLSEGGFKPDLLVLPAVAFDPWGRDLTGHSYLELANEGDLPVALI